MIKFGKEESIQVSIFDWALLHAKKYPELEFMYHTPNGSNKSRFGAYKFKRMGLKSGVPDICLPVAKKGFHGLYIELKAPKGSKEKNQIKYIDFLTQQGYMAVFCMGFDAAINTITNYLNE